MCETAQRRLKPADDYRQPGKGLAYAVGVDNDGMIRPQTGLLAGGIEILAARLLGGGVMRYHGVEIAGAKHRAETRPAHGEKRVC